MKSSFMISVVILACIQSLLISVSAADAESGMTDILGDLKEFPELKPVTPPKYRQPSKKKSVSNVPRPTSPLPVIDPIYRDALYNQWMIRRKTFASVVRESLKNDAKNEDETDDREFEDLSTAKSTASELDDYENWKPSSLRNRKTVSNFKYASTNTLYYQSQPKVEYPGLNNLGVTCYMNVALQTLYHLAPFREAVLNLEGEYKPKSSFMEGLGSLFGDWSAGKKHLGQSSNFWSRPTRDDPFFPEYENDPSTSSQKHTYSMPSLESHHAKLPLSDSGSQNNQHSENPFAHLSSPPFAASKYTKNPFTDTKISMAYSDSDSDVDSTHAIDTLSGGFQPHLLKRSLDDNDGLQFDDDYDDLYFGSIADFSSSGYGDEEVLQPTLEPGSSDSDDNLLEATVPEHENSQVSLALKNVFQKMKEWNGGPIDTSALPEALGWSRNRILREQQDPDEFMKILLDRIEHDLKTPTEDKIRDLFHGEITQNIVCIDADCRSSRSEEFTTLNVAVKGNHNLTEALKMQTATETLRGQNQYHAADGNYYDANIHTAFTKLPPILSIALKRYDFERGALVKLNSRFEYPLEIDLSEFVAGSDSSAVYHLYSVIVHSGEYHRGHYTALMRPDPSSGHWYKFDDKIVRHATLHDVLESNYGGMARPGSPDASLYRTERSFSAYMLIYVRESDMNRILPGKHAIDFNKLRQEAVQYEQYAAHAEKIALEKQRMGRELRAKALAKREGLLRAMVVKKEKLAQSTPLETKNAQPNELTIEERQQLLRQHLMAGRPAEPVKQPTKDSHQLKPNNQGIIETETSKSVGKPSTRKAQFLQFLRDRRVIMATLGVSAAVAWQLWLLYQEQRKPMDGI